MALTLIAAGGCAPSLRATQRSQVYFERCYAADFDPRIPGTEKHACWDAWLEHYAAHQPRERVEYARERSRGLARGRAVAPLPGIPEAAMGPTGAASVAAASAGGDEADESRWPPPRERRYRRQLPRTSNPTCAAAACEAPWRDCLAACEDRPACRNACTVELRACARGCY